MQTAKELQRKQVSDVNGNLWFVFTDGVSERYVLASPPKRVGGVNTPVSPVKSVKALRFHQIRNQQWQEDWQHEWVYNGETYCTGKHFDSLDDIRELPLHTTDERMQYHANLVFKQGRVYYAYYYPNSDQFILESVYRTIDGKPTHTGWGSVKTLQPIYKVSNLNKPL